MHVLLSTYGSRGDVQPFVAFAKALQAIDVKASICAPPEAEFVDLLARENVPFVPAFSTVQDWVDTARREGLGMPELTSRMIQAHYDTITLVKDCDAIVATGLFPSVAAAQMAAEKRNLPFTFVAFDPALLPAASHPPMPYPGWPNPPEMTDNRDLWNHNARAMNALFGDTINAHRVSIGLPTVDNIRDHVFTAQPWIASDPVLSPWSPSEALKAVQSGAWILPDPRPLPQELEQFLAAGEPPIYVGFGSMRLEAAQDAGAVAVASARALGHRIILSRGWAALSAADDSADCIEIGEVNHQALFGRVAAVVHHGGAGTTITAAQSGVPQVIVPQVADQPIWAARVAGLGIGVHHPGPVPTIESLSAAITAARTPEMVRAADAISGEIRIDGADRAARMLLTKLEASGR